MGAQAPQWLLTSFVDAMQQIGATATQSDLEKESVDLAERWSAPERQMHNVRRLMNTLTHIDDISSSAHDPDILRVGTTAPSSTRRSRSSLAGSRRTLPPPVASTTRTTASPSSACPRMSSHASTNSLPS